MTLAFITHPDCLLHDMGPHHPESPARLHAINDQLIASGIDVLLKHYDAPFVTREQLLRVHDADYIDRVVASVPEQGMVYLDPDTAMNPHSLRAAQRAAGAVVKAVDLVLSGEVQDAFCSVRPPGHHAEHDRAMGFCIFNNVAVGAAHAMAVYGLERVAIVDFDVHHGNGTEDIFRNEPRVLLCSSFQHPYYPHSGNEPRESYEPVPLAAGAGGEAFRQAIQERWLPALHAFKPQLVICSAGFDAHLEDDLASLNLVEDDYAWVTREIKRIAEEYADSRLVSVLEGGYALSALGRSVVAHLQALI